MSGSTILSPGQPTNHAASASASPPPDHQATGGGECRAGPRKRVPCGAWTRHPTLTCGTRRLRTSMDLQTTACGTSRCERLGGTCYSALCRRASQRSVPRMRHPNPVAAPGRIRVSGRWVGLLFPNAQARRAQGVGNHRTAFPSMRRVSTRPTRRWLRRRSEPARARGYARPRSRIGTLVPPSTPSGTLGPGRGPLVYRRRTVSGAHRMAGRRIGTPCTPHSPERRRLLGAQHRGRGLHSRLHAERLEPICLALRPAPC